jgi:hypothetical protein
VAEQPDPRFLVRRARVASAARRPERRSAT